MVITNLITQKKTRITKRLIAMRTSHQLGNQQLMEEDKAVPKKNPSFKD